MIRFQGSSMYVSFEDANDREQIMEIAQDGSTIRTLDLPVNWRGSFIPHPNGEFFIYRDDTVRRYDNTGIETGMFGGFGSGQGKFDSDGGAIEMTLSPSGEVYMFDFGNARIQVFDQAGAYQREWPVDQVNNTGFCFFDGPANSLFLSIRSNSLDKLGQFTPQGINVQEWAYPDEPFFNTKQHQFLKAGGEIIFQDYLNNRLVVYDIP